MARRIGAVLGITLLLSLPAGAAWATTEEVVEPDRGTVDGAPPSPPETAGVMPGAVTLRVAGRVVEYARVGETVDATVSFHNYSEETLRDVVVKLVGGGARLIRDDAKLGTIEPRSTSDGVFTFEVLGEGCTDFLGFEVHAAWTGGEAVSKVGFPARCPGPRLFIESVEYVGGDGDQVADPGERLEVHVVLRNNGADPATDVRGTMKLLNGDGVSIVRDDSSWPDIAPDRTGKSERPFVIQIASDAKRAEGCEPMRTEGIVVDPAPSAGTSAGGAEPGATGSTDDGSTSTTPEGAGSSPDGTTMIAPAPPEDGNTSSDRAEPSYASDAPVSSGPDGDDPKNYEEPVAVENGVPFEINITGRASEATFEAPYGTGIVCAFMESTAGGRDLGPTSARQDDARSLQAATQPVAARDRTGAVSVATLLAIAAAGLLTRRVMLARR